VSITLTNANPNEPVDLELTLTENLKPFAGQIVTGEQITDSNDFGEKKKVILKDFDPGKAIKGVLKLSIPSKSVVLIQLRK